ncbi:MAG: hypothetical protein KJ072_14775 [Verrucomicrobia bacterium]|nr:hypothetical protein [Verrucomicrobiota bacterium]
MSLPRTGVISSLSLIVVISGCLTPGTVNAGEWNWHQLTTNAPPTVAYYTRVYWTGWELLTWGAQSTTDGAYRAVGWRWNPEGNRIRYLPTEGAPPWPDGQSVLWTGRYLAIWGGRRTGDPTSDTNEGYLYDPVEDQWKRMSTVNAPTRRAQHGAVWTGNEMLVWGGSHLRSEGTGYEITFPEDFGAYDPTTDTWRRLASADSPVGREKPCLAWSGTELLLWGGTRLTGDWDDLHYVYYSELFRFDPASAIWSQSLAPGAPAGRADHAAAWTGTEWVIWGGYNGRTYAKRVVLSDGARYCPTKDLWTPINAEHSLGPRERPIAVWNGAEVIFWCGERQPCVGARYHPSQDTWSPLPTENAPASAEAGNAAWNGESLLAVGDDLFALDAESLYRGDLLPDDWQESHFGVDNPLAAPDRDPDGDGWINRHEWLYLTDPADGRSHPALQALLTPTHAQVSIREADPFLQFTLDLADDLWTWSTPLTAPPVRQDGRLRWDWPRPTGAVGFLRLRVADPSF